MFEQSGFGKHIDHLSESSSCSGNQVRGARHAHQDVASGQVGYLWIFNLRMRLQLGQLVSRRAHKLLGFHDQPMKDALARCDTQTNPVYDMLTMKRFGSSRLKAFVTQTPQRTNGICLPRDRTFAYRTEITRHGDEPLCHDPRRCCRLPHEDPERGRAHHDGAAVGVGLRRGTVRHLALAPRARGRGGLRAAPAGACIGLSPGAEGRAAAPIDGPTKDPEDLRVSGVQGCLGLCPGVLHRRSMNEGDARGRSAVRSGFGVGASETRAAVGAKCGFVSIALKPLL